MVAKSWAWLAMAMASALLGSCGGGTGAAGTGGGNASGISENQRMFEEYTLSGNGGSYLIGPSYTGGPQAAFLSFTASKFELPVSPVGVASGVVGIYTPAVDLIASLPTPNSRKESNENVGSVFLESGRIGFLPTNNAPRITYQGSDIRSEAITPTGQVAVTTLITGHVRVALTGTIANAPQEFRDLYAFDNAHTSSTATFLAGAAYYNQTRHRVGDVLFLQDSDADSATDPKSATPVAVGTIEQYAAAHPTQIPLSSGTIRTLKGARCWVQQSPLATATVPSYLAFCEVSDKLYRATLVADGANVGTGYPTTVGPAYFNSVPTSVRVNAAAAESMKSILH